MPNCLSIPGGRRIIGMGIDSVGDGSEMRNNFGLLTVSRVVL